MNGRDSAVRLPSAHAGATLTHLRDRDQEAQSRPLDFRLITRLFRYTRPYAAKRYLLLMFVVVRSIQLPALACVITAVIKGPIEARDTTGVMWGVFGFVLLALSTQVVLHFRQRFALELGEAVVFDLRNELFRHLQRLPMSFFNKTKLGRIISRMNSDVQNVRTGVQEVLFVGLVQVGQMLAAAACMLWFDWVLFMLVLALVPVLWTINHHFRPKLSSAHRNVQESFSRVTATLAESVNGIRVTQAFVRQDQNAKLFRDLVTEHADNHVIVARTQGTLLPLLDLNSQLFMATLLLAGGYRVLNPAIDASVGDLIGFFLMANLFFNPISNLGLQYNQALTSMAAAERVFHLLDKQPEWRDAPDAIVLPAIRGRVEFRDLSFEYDRDRPVLQKISFTVDPGQTVALVGHTGSGKTTITNLLAKFYLPTEGKLLIDGQSVHKIQTDALHRHIGIVPQESFLFSGTVMENVRFGAAHADADQVVDAVGRLGCLDVINGLCDGFETDVGERGGNLSAGQRQLVCFARAMLADPRILILDEATSSIDTVTELRVQRSLERLLRGRTSLVVAHRLSTVRHADLILILEHGRIIERGTHFDLVAAGGAYSDLYRSFVQGHGVQNRR
jgi:ATP-binding cassette subfamily B protein